MGQQDQPKKPLPPEKKNFLYRLSDWIWSPPKAGDSRTRSRLRAVLRIHLIVYRELCQDRIPLRSSALTFTVILSMVPMLALGTAVLKGLGADGRMREAAYVLIERLDSTTLPLSDIIQPDEKAPTAVVENEDSETSEDEETSDQSASLTTHLKRAVDIVFDYVEKTNFATLGALGIVGLALSVISVLSSIEAAMNDIWQTAQGRPFGRKLMDYLALMVLVPITINVGVAAMTALQNPAFKIWLQKIIPWAGHLMLNLLPVLAVVLTFSILYSFLPNTRVKPSSALTGGFFGGLAWLLTQALFIKMQIGVARYNAIYGSFATLPLFLLWIYVGWIIFLAGAEISFACQVWRNYTWISRPLTPISRLGLAFDIARIIAIDFQERRLTSVDSLVTSLNRADEHINSIVIDLEEAGMIREVVRDKVKGYILAGPTETIKAEEIGRLILDRDNAGLVPENPAVAVREAVRSALAGRKISTDQGQHLSDPVLAGQSNPE